MEDLRDGTIWDKQNTISTRREPVVGLRNMQVGPHFHVSGTSVFDWYSPYDSDARSPLTPKVLATAASTRWSTQSLGM